MRFSVFTHVEHLVKDGKFYAYSPYVREMNVWFSNVDEVEVVAPCFGGNINPIFIPYQKENLNLTVIPSVSFISGKAFFKSLFRIPGILVKIFGAMGKADHIHIRCPGNIGLLACIVQIFFPHKQKTAKFAGNWDPKSSQPWSYNLQKFLLNNTFLTRNMNVLVYGDWKNQSKNIIPFFTATFICKDKIIQHKTFSDPFNFLFVGNLVKGKNPLFAIQLIQKLVEKGISAELEIFGEGILKEKLMEYVSRSNMNTLVRFRGNVELETLKNSYKSSHFLILASKSEGWPKAIAEAMFFGCIPIATPVSCVPWMLGEGKKGFIIEEDVPTTINQIISHLKDTQKLEKMSFEAQKWSQQYTLEKFKAEIKNFL